MTSTLRKTKSTTSVRKQTINDRISLIEMAMCWAEDAAYRSTCDRLQVGSIIFSKDFKKVLGYGYNGNYAGGPNHCDSNEEGNCGDIHSEINALISCEREADMIMVVTHAPCLSCAKCIINSGIKTLYYRRDYRKEEGLKLLKKMIDVIKVD